MIFAKVNALTYKVTNIIEAEDDTFIDALPDSDFWVQTDVNSFAGKYYTFDSDNNPIEDTETPHLRYNAAQIGFKYDVDADAFIPPQPYPSWTLDTDTYTWICPEPYPSTGYHRWNEDNLAWEEYAFPDE